MEFRGGWFSLVSISGVFLAMVLFGGASAADFLVERSAGGIFVAVVSSLMLVLAGPGLVAEVRHRRMKAVVDRDGVELFPWRAARFTWSEILAVDLIHVSAFASMVALSCTGPAWHRFYGGQPRTQQWMSRLGKDRRIMVPRIPHARALQQWLEAEVDRRAGPVAIIGLALHGHTVTDEVTGHYVPWSRLGLSAQLLADLDNWHLRMEHAYEADMSDEQFAHLWETVMEPEAEALSARLAAELGPGVLVRPPEPA